MNQVCEKRHKHSSENQLNPIIKLHFKKKKKNKHGPREGNSSKMPSGAVMQPGLTTSTSTAAKQIKPDTPGAGRIGEVG